MSTPTGNTYFDPSYTNGINGSTHSITGETLEFGINAFSLLNEAISASVIGTNLYVSNFSGDLNISQNVNIQLYDNYVPSFAVSSSEVSDGDIHVIILNSTVATNNSYVAGDVGTHAKDIDVLVQASTIGDGQNIRDFRLVNRFTFTGESQNVSLTISDSVIRDDINLLSNSTIGSKDFPATVMLTLERVTVPDDKWFWITNSTQKNTVYADIIFNLFHYCPVKVLSYD